MTIQVDKIYIPTLGRSHKQITFDLMPTSVQKITELVVQPKEKDLYPNYPTVVLPDNDIGISETRRWIYKNAKDITYGMFDDDLKFIRRTPDGPKSKRVMNEDDWNYMLSETDRWLEGDFAFAGFRQGDLPPSGKPFTDISGVNCAYFFNGPKLPDESELDWSFVIAEDIHLVLQLLGRGYKNRIWDEFGYLSKILADGGCQEFRTFEMVKEIHDKLVETYPDHVVWSGTNKEILGGEVEKIKIKWKRMYTHPPGSNLDGFFGENK